MTLFVDAQRLASIHQATRISTGSPQLDDLTGGVNSEALYLFYGEDELVETLLRHLLANSLKPTIYNSEPEAIYVICGNYRKERITIDTEPLIRLLESSGQGFESALKRVHILVASSADQQASLTGELERIVSTRRRIRLVLVKGIYKLSRDDARKKNRGRVAEEVQRSITAMKRICASAGVPLVASAREEAGGSIPTPEASDYLNHLAGVIVYLRHREGEAKFNRAYVLKSPLTAKCSRDYCFEDEDRGRTTPPISMSFEDLLSKLRTEYRSALVKQGRREAFDRLVEACSAELGAISYAESFSLMGLVLLTGLVDDRRVSEELSSRITDIERSLSHLEQKREE
ncbi:MAG: hypothetical protein NTV15_05625 [Candidatus Bathyarchaeota archaeon]|nr:hypothetical protein [Candidatus Bathyarchaeota archaeon]